MMVSSSLRMAVCILVYMAELDNNKFTLSADIAGKLGFPKDYLSKILGQLVKAQILQAAKGKWGGYALVKPVEEITLLQVHEAIEGRIEVFHCENTKQACELFETDCPIIGVYDNVFNQIRSILSNVTIAQIIQQVQP